MRMFDDDAVPMVGALDVRGGFVQGAGPAHLQDRHARTVRHALAPQEPELVQRAPARSWDGNSPSPQAVPALASTDQIDLAEVTGIETAMRPGQASLAGWDGENDAFAPDWTRPTFW